MGNRFGRNQKRRMRAEIAAKQEQASNAMHLLTGERVTAGKLRERLSRLNEQVAMWDSEIERLLGVYSSFRFEAGKLVTDRKDQTFQLAEYRLPQYAGGPTDVVPDSVACAVHQIRHIVVDSDALADLRQYMRVRIVDYHGSIDDARYALSKRHLAQAKLGPRERAFIADRIAGELVEFINAGRGDRRRQEKAHV